jgi:hypothetical protein
VEGEKKKNGRIGNEGKIDICPADGEAVFHMRFFREAANKLGRWRQRSTRKGRKK